MARTHRKRGAQRSADQSGVRTSDLEKATAAEKRASAIVTRVRGKLTDAIRALVNAKAGGAREDKAWRTSGAVMKDLMAAKKKLRKAQKKRKKAAARLKAKRGKAASVQTDAAAPSARRRRVRKRKPAQVRPKALPAEQETPRDIAPVKADAAPDTPPTDAEALAPQ